MSCNGLRYIALGLDFFAQKCHHNAMPQESTLKSILTLREAAIRYGNKVIFESLDLTMHAGRKICLVGRNGAGKTTLMRLITGEQDLDSGERWTQPGLKIGVLPQDVVPVQGQSIFDYIAERIDEKTKSEEAFAYRIEQVCDPLELDPDKPLDSLSGGQLRRAALAKALVEDPDLLLLDEPTNHLDLPGIEWLENFLKNWRGTVLCVSHDKRFLESLTDTVYWLDRGQIRTSNRGFKEFERWSKELLEQEARALQNRQKMVEQEQEWALKGISARRKRNVRRLELLRKEREKLKADKVAYRATISRVELPPATISESSKIVTEFYNVSHSFAGERPVRILDRFNFRIMKGDRIGILGHNGSGKSSFLSLLVGGLTPEQGKVKRAKGLEYSYFDQRRQALDLKETVQHNLIPGGGDYIRVGDKDRHVCGYLKQFLFDPACVRDPVATLSGGQKNRLLLAKILAAPKPFLILDEPTNDLDMDTLEMLEEILGAYEGTLILVSHDRDFLDRTVTKILSFEGDGQVELYMGGYSDYLNHKASQNKRQAPTKNNKKTDAKTAAKQSKGLTYKLQYELDHLPADIQVLEERISELKEKLSQPDLYHRDKQAFEKATARLASSEKDLSEKEERWITLSLMQTDGA